MHHIAAFSGSKNRCLPVPPNVREIRVRLASSMYEWPEK